MEDRKLELQEKMKAKKQDRIQKIKKEDNKYLIIMILIMVLCSACSFALGVCIRKVQESGVDFAGAIRQFRNTMIYVMPFIFAGVNILVGIISAVYISKAKKLLNVWDGEDEDMADKIDGMLGVVGVITAVLNILDFFMFAVSVNLDVNSTMSDKGEDVHMLVNTAIFIIGIIVAMVAQRQVINILKIMNPEKEGSIYDCKLSQKWMNSCDEAQQLMIYKCGYRGYKTTTSTCIVLWVVCVIGDLFFNMGLAPVFMVTVIWLAAVISYMIESGKSDKSGE